MSKAAVFSFLRDLQENNHKEWMDANRERYMEAKEIWLHEVEQMLQALRKHDEALISGFKPKDTISRINNNRRFQPDKPLYKDYFTFSIMDRADVYSPIHVSVGASGSFVGCGYHQPDKDTLKNIREAIDFEGDKLRKILDGKEFKAFYGGMSNMARKLRTVPRGYDKAHPHAYLLRFTSYVISKDLSEKEVLSKDFIGTIEKAYVLAKPFREFLRKANSM